MIASLLGSLACGVVVVSGNLNWRAIDPLDGAGGSRTRVANYCELFQSIICRWKYWWHTCWHEFFKLNEVHLVILRLGLVQYI